MNRWEIQAVLTLDTVITQEGFSSSFKFSELQSRLVSPVYIFSHYSFIQIDLSSVLFELMKEETFNVLVLNTFAFRKNVEDRQWRKIGYFCQLFKNFWNVIFFFELRLDKIFQSMNP